MVYAELEAAAGLRPGDFVTVRVTEPAVDDVVRLPAAALGADGQVLVVEDENRLQALPVTLVRRQADDVLVRGDGLAGRDVVAARTPLLGPGIAVRVIGPSPSDEARAAAPSDMLELSAERRARLVAFIEANDRMPEADKARVLAQLSERQVPAQVVERLERRMGG
jgi:hypothetical protein